MKKTHLKLILQSVLLPLHIVELPVELLLGRVLCADLLVQGVDLGVELPLLFLQQSVSRGLFLQKQLGVVQLAVGLLGLSLPRGCLLADLIDLFVGVVEL